MKSSSILIASLLLVESLVVATPGAQAAPPPPSLAGEVFLGTQGPGDAVGTCNSGAASGTFTFHATGTATGPYPGTFVEDITVGAQFLDSLPESAPTMTSLHATFTITTDTGTVTGTKDLPLFAPGFACCTGASQPIFYGFFETTALTYSATIDSGGRKYVDSGTAKARNAEFDGNRSAGHKLFTEEFLTSNGISPAEPLTREECMNEGWKAFPQKFKSLGECIAYVERHRVG